ncbi:MAG TPA: methyltransferase domain-containing protein [Candidatus Dormibacteraeota bacterium]|jgi:SAM-dependent methyltransferase
MSDITVTQVELSPEVEGTSSYARLNRYRMFDEVNAPYMRWQLQQFEPYLGKRLLEVGCGVGSILAQLRPREFVMGVDVEDDLIEYARQRFLNAQHHEFAALDISSHSIESRLMLKGQRFDTIICINVLEHVQDDVAAVAAMADVVDPGGAVAILVPAHPALFGQYDEMEGHYRRYSRKGLRRLIMEAGLDLVRLHRFNMLGAAGWWFQYRLLRRRIHGQGHFKTLQAVLPVLKAVEKRIKPPFGLSLVAVARKRR